MRRYFDTDLHRRDIAASRRFAFPVAVLGSLIAIALVLYAIDIVPLDAILAP